MSALHARGLSKSFRGRKVVDRVSFDVNPGEVVGLLHPDEGEVHLGGQDLSGLPLHRRARMGLGYLPQESSIFRKLTVRQNLLLVLEGQGVHGGEARGRTDDVLQEFDLLRVADSLGEQLSGGERRRTEIARALLAEPRFLLFDEPFAGIDPIAVHELQRLIGKLRERGLGVLISDHAVRETLGICDRAVLLVEGRLLEAGTPPQIAASERARAVYLGERFKLE